MNPVVFSLGRRFKQIDCHFRKASYYGVERFFGEAHLLIPKVKV
jgi:hypothetical protein